jgi:signal peptidase II
MFKVKDRKFRALVSVFAGGALGNFVDRLLHGSVVDFLDFYIFGYNFPTFNVADSFIVVGTFLLVIYLIKNKGILAQLERKSS